MATSTQEWIDELKGISVLELAERIKALEEEFGVSAAAVAAPVAAAGAGGGEAAAEEEGPSTFDVILTGAGDKKIQVIKVVRAPPVSASRRPRRSSTRPPSRSRRASKATRPTSSSRNSRRPGRPSS